MATRSETLTDRIMAAMVTIAAGALGGAIELTRLARLTRLDVAALAACFGGGFALWAIAVTASTAASTAAAPAAAAVAGLFSGVGTFGLALQADRRFFSGCRLRRRTFAAAAFATLTAFSASATVATFAALTAAVARTLAFEVGGVALLFHEVGDVEEGVALQADVHEGGLHARKDTRDASVIDGASERVFVLALVVDLGEFVLLDDGKPRLLRRAGYIDFFRHCCSFCPRRIQKSGHKLAEQAGSKPSGALAR